MKRTQNKMLTTKMLLIAVVVFFLSPRAAQGAVLVYFPEEGVAAQLLAQAAESAGYVVEYFKGKPIGFWVDEAAPGCRTCKPGDGLKFRTPSRGPITVCGETYTKRTYVNLGLGRANFDHCQGAGTNIEVCQIGDVAELPEFEKLFVDPEACGTTKKSVWECFMPGNREGSKFWKNYFKWNLTPQERQLTNRVSNARTTFAPPLMAVGNTPPAPESNPFQPVGVTEAPKLPIPEADLPCPRPNTNPAGGGWRPVGSSMLGGAGSSVVLGMAERKYQGEPITVRSTAYDAGTGALFGLGLAGVAYVCPPAAAGICIGLGAKELKKWGGRACERRLLDPRILKPEPLPPGYVPHEPASGFGIN